MDVQNVATAALPRSYRNRRQAARSPTYFLKRQENGIQNATGS
jgi:hypothetical protein